MMRATQRRGARVHPIPGDVRPGSTDDDHDQMTAFDGTPMHDDGQPTREATTLRGVNPAELLRSPEEVSSRVLQVILERAAADSRPGARSDEHIVCLAVEGGGLRGSVTAGMCVVLEAAGLVQCFDRVYGVSAGALSAAAVAVGQAALNATRFQDAATRQVISRIRPLVGRAMVDFDFLFGELIAGRKPLALPARIRTEVRLLATSLDELSLRVLTDFAGAVELHQAIRASAAMPLVAGPPAMFRGERMADGALIEAIPYQSALREGATHVLVLRSRPPSFRQPPYVQLAERLAMRRHPEVSDVLRDRPDAYNRQADELERLTLQVGESPVAQITVPDHARIVGRFDPNPSRVVESLRLGAAALARAVLDEPIELCWQPVAYRSAPRTRRSAALEPRPSEQGAEVRAALRHGAALLRRVGAPATVTSSPDP